MISAALTEGPKSHVRYAQLFQFYRSNLQRPIEEGSLQVVSLPYSTHTTRIKLRRLLVASWEEDGSCPLPICRPEYVSASGFNQAAS